MSLGRPTYIKKVTLYTGTCTHPLMMGNYSYLEAIKDIIGFNGFWSHVIDGATANISLNACLLCLNSVGNAKVNEFEPGPYAHKVLWLQVIVDNALIVDHL